MTTFHVATGAAVLGLSFLIALRARRLLAPPRPAHDAAAVPGAAAAG